MKHGIRAMVGALAGASLVAGGAGAAHAAGPSDLACSGRHNGGVIQNLTVVKGATCVLTSATVKGSVVLTQGGSLTLERVHVLGGITDPEPMGSDATELTVKSSSIDGAVSLAGIRSVYTDSRLASLRVSGAVGDDTTLTRTRVFGDVVADGRSSGFRMTRSTVDGSLTAKGGGPDIESSTIRGASDLAGYGITVCGSSLAGTTLSASRSLVLGDGQACHGNVFRGDLTAPYAIARSSVYYNTVTGRTTSWMDRTSVQGSGNRFQGGVTGALAAVAAA